MSCHSRMEPVPLTEQLSVFFIAEFATALKDQATLLPEALMRRQITPRT